MKSTHLLSPLLLLLCVSQLFAQQDREKHWGNAGYDAAFCGLPPPPTKVSISLIFPNPVENMSSVILPASYAYQAVRLDILDISGHLVSSQENIQGKDLVIERKQLSEGQYVFRVSCKDGTVFHERFTIE